jgi:hypothetical protein
MGKHLSKIFVLAICLLTAGFIVAAKAPAEGKQYDYVTIEKIGYVLYLSEGNDKYEEIKIKEESKDERRHYGPLYKRVNEFEARGYEVYNTNTIGYSTAHGTTMGTIVLLRKPR